MKRSYFILIAIMFAFISCNNERKEVDISEIDVDIQINRLDKEIFEIDLGKVQDESVRLLNDYEEFFDLYNLMIVKLGNPRNEAYPQKLTGFVTDFTMNKVYKKAMEVYPNLDMLESELESAFAYFRYYFPEKKIPAVYTYIGGFNQSIVVADSILGIGLDKYLGADCAFYDRLGIANYLQSIMIKEMISIDVLKAWLSTEYEYNKSVDNVVNNMVYHGKIQYALRSFFPEKKDSLLYGFTGEQIRWCINNEDQMWNYLIDEKLIFSTDYMMINQLINPAPFTAGFPKESPGRATVWLGEKIIAAYMKRNPKITLSDLMKDDDYQKILTESRYEP